MNTPVKDIIKTEKGNITVNAINHATFVIETGDKTIIVDPVGSAGAFSSFKKPDIILITDIHGDHLNADVVKGISADKTVIVGPEGVAEKLTETKIIKNGEKKNFAGIQIKAIPMYNLTKERLKFHPKGRGNGYILTVHNKRIYISGDTEDIPEMRRLKNIDVAFVCMNLPYTMTVEKAADAVNEFKPKVVYPYHYRGKKDGKKVYSDINRFKKLVAGNKDINVKFLKWY